MLKCDVGESLSYDMADKTNPGQAGLVSGRPDFPSQGQ